MPISTRLFTGKLDYDTHPFRVAESDFIDALNITRDNGSSTGGDGVPQNIIGNQLVAYTFPIGTQRTIGKYPDKVRNRMYYCVWNSNSKHSILYYDKGLNTVVKVFENLTDSGSVDILGWNPSYRINHIDIIHRDEGDLFCFTDGLNPPRKINITTAITGGYGVWLESYINVIKAPPQIPPAVVYENDATITVNNLRKKLFKIKYEYEYDDFERSVTSSQSELPLPVNYLDVAIDKDPTKNARIAIVVQTGTSRVKKIRISVAQSLGSVYSDFFLVKVIDKAAEGIADNDITTYRFFNNQAYTYLPIQQSILAFDWVPQKAYNQCMPNGNVLCYGAITEGYNPAVLTGSSSVSAITERTTQLPFIFVASQSGNSGFGTGNIHTIVIGSIVVGDVFNIYTTGATITFTATVATTTNVIEGLATAAFAAGFTIISFNSENLVMIKTGEALQRILATPVLRAVTDSFVFDYSSRYEPATVYFDENGRTCGAIIKSGLSVQTGDYNKSAGTQVIPKISLSITSRPPLEARYFHVIFSKNTTESSLLDWVSDRTYKDKDFAYIGIENLNDFINKNPQSPLGYGFAQGDRIRFMQVLSGAVNTIYGSSFDFEIQSEIFNPLVDGIIRQGQFIKIALPATSGTFDFGTNDFFNYFIKLYTPAQSVANGLDVYYEVSERYMIGNPGTINAYHQGMLQNQTSDLVTPATFEFTKGDFYYRRRTIETGGKLNYDLSTGERGAGRHTMGVTFADRTFTDANIVTGDSPLQNLAGWTAASNTRAIIKMGVGAPTTTFRAKGTISVDPQYADTFGWFFIDNTSVITYAVTQRPITDAPQIFSFDCSFVLAAGQHISFLGWSDTDATNSKQYYTTDLEITVVNPFTVGVVDPNFSDFFASAVNSYGRAWVNDSNAKQTHYPTLRRNGGEFQEDTTINNINRFYFDAQDTYNRNFGDIRKMFVNGSNMYVFQKFDIGVVPILRQVVVDVQGNPLQANSDVLLNKIYYPYEGEIGIGDVPESFAHGKFAMYGCDNNKGIVWRLSNNGLTVLSVLYKCNSFFIPLLESFRKDLNNGIAATGSVYTGDPTIVGCYDAFTNKYVIALQEINRYSSPSVLVFHQDAQTISFLETRDTTEGFESKYSFLPDSVECLDNLLISWKNGTVWTHDNPIFNKFYDVQYDSTITPVFGNESRAKKTFEVISETGSVVWDCPSITTSLMSYGTTPQQSNLVVDDFHDEEGEYNAPFLRDTNSVAGLNVGDVLKGKYVIVKLRAANASNFVFLNSVTVGYIESPLNKR